MEPSFIKKSYTSTNIRIRIIFLPTLKNFALRQSEIQIDNDLLLSFVCKCSVSINIYMVYGYMVYLG